MDYIREFDIRLEKEMYYAGETLSGRVILSTVENFKLKGIKVILRGKAHAEWKVIVSGERQTVKDDQSFVEDRQVIWGREKSDGPVPILPRGNHSFSFRFQLPESSLPCSFESKPVTIRYYVKVALDVPYASPPQGVKYFTVIGPHIDCMDEQYLKPRVGKDRRSLCCLCCRKNLVQLRSTLERTAYSCGESLRFKADIDNESEESVKLRMRLTQYADFFIERGPITLSKESSHTILEYHGDDLLPHTRSRFDSGSSLVLPVMPPTLKGVCRLVNIHYMLKVWVQMEKSGEDLHMSFPVTIATCPFRIPNSPQQPVISYEPCCDHAEGGTYIGPEFQLGQVYDGTLGTDMGETVVLYRPVYVCVKHPTRPSIVASTMQQQQQQQSDNEQQQQQPQLPKSPKSKNAKKDEK